MGSTNAINTTTPGQTETLGFLEHDIHVTAMPLTVSSQIPLTKKVVLAIDPTNCVRNCPPDKQTFQTPNDSDLAILLQHTTGKANAPDIKPHFDMHLQ